MFSSLFLYKEKNDVAGFENRVSTVNHVTTYQYIYIHRFYKKILFDCFLHTEFKKLNVQVLCISNMPMDFLKRFLFGFVGDLRSR